jgi:hypothetical protein
MRLSGTWMGSGLRGWVYKLLRSRANNLDVLEIWKTELDTKWLKASAAFLRISSWPNF